MTSAKYDVLAIGNAIFDILVQTDENFLARHGMTKGGMALIDEARALAIYDAMGPAVEMSGGSAANTIVGVANLGARAAYVGKVKDDQQIKAVSTATATSAPRGSRPRDQSFRSPPAPPPAAAIFLGDAGRRAHHEHLSRRGAGVDAR